MMLSGRSRRSPASRSCSCCSLRSPVRPRRNSPGGAMQGLSINRDQPVKIESNTLEVRDKIRQATFIGDVKLIAGRHDAEMRDAGGVLRGHRHAPGSKKAPQGAPQAQKSGGGSSGQQIKRAEAKGNVFVTQKDQTASGDFGMLMSNATPSR